MKKYICLFLFASLGLLSYGQTGDAVDNLINQKPLSDYHRDSIIYNVGQRVGYISDYIYHQSRIGRYKIYPTENIYTTLKLDTATGRVTALQIGINNDSSRMEYEICGEDTSYEIIGRYELYPTGNMYNFILLDTIYGRAYQVQWSTKAESRGIWRIYE